MIRYPFATKIAFQSFYLISTMPDNWVHFKKDQVCIFIQGMVQGLNVTYMNIMWP